MLTMIKKNKWQLMISSVIILLPMLAGLLIWNYLPEQIAIHWGFDGEPDGWGGRGFTILAMPLTFLAIHWVCIFFTAHDPKNEDQSNKILNIVLWILPITSLIVCGLAYVFALGIDVNIGMMVRVPLGVLFVILGNYMPKCKQNHTIGVKVKWTLRNEENWNKTHRFTGRLWVFGGIILLATMFVPMEYFMYVLFPLILLMAFAPMLYSYIYYRKQLKAGTAAKENAVQTPSEKRMTRISLAVIAVVLVLTGILLFTGKFEVTFHETSFTIDANYWNNVTVNYADIDNIEYRNQGTPGTRTFGYGTPFIVMGKCENKEFGNYTGYAYKSCDAGIVLTVNDKILVISGKDEGQTKAIYDELIKRMSE